MSDCQRRGQSGHDENPEHCEHAAEKTPGTIRLTCGRSGLRRRHIRSNVSITRSLRSVVWILSQSRSPFLLKTCPRPLQVHPVRSCLKRRCFRVRCRRDSRSYLTAFFQGLAFSAATGASASSRSRVISEWLLLRPRNLCRNRTLTLRCCVGPNLPAPQGPLFTL